MKKSELVEKVESLVNSHKVTKAFKEELSIVLTEYLSSSNKSEEAIKQIIEIDNVEYAWCNKHLRYEIATNFKNGTKGRKYQVSCRSAEAEILSISKEVREIDDELMTGELSGEEALEMLNTKKQLIEKRKGTYDFENRIQGIEQYDYDTQTYTLEDVKAL